MGFYHDNRDMDFEISKLSLTVEKINKAHPDMVVLTGDYVHDPTSQEQWNEFLRIIGGIDQSIRTVVIPGNHDVLDKDGKIDMTPYTRHLGKDRFAERIGNAYLIGLNSNFMKNVEQNSSEEQSQFAWLKKTLKKKHKKDHVIVFLHHPFFLENYGEEEGYSTLSESIRNKYFSLFDEYGVEFVIAGHLHDNREANHNGIEMVTTSAAGRQLGTAQPGIRIIQLRKGNISQQYFTLEQLPMLKLPTIGFGATKSTLFMTIGSDKVFVTFTHITDATFFIGMVGNSEAGTLFTKPTTGNPSLPTAR